MIELSKAGSVSALVQMLWAHLVSPRSSGNVTLPPAVVIANFAKAFDNVYPLWFSSPCLPK